MYGRLMKRLIASILLLTGCNPTMYPEDHTVATKTCERNDGYSIYTIFKGGKLEVVCKDSARFTVPRDPARFRNSVIKTEQ